MSSSYRIGYLNPWKEKAENQAFFSLAEGARRIGHTLIHVTNSDEILDANPDFVIAVASTQPKLTHIPTFAAVHEPRVRFWEKSAYFQNLLTYDGYLTISDSLRSFLTAFCAGYDKDVGIGRYYNTPQRQSFSADVRVLLDRDQLRLCYFGTNWDPRSRPLFRALSRKQYTRIYGPESAWSYLEGKAYCGVKPFDGVSVQQTYAEFGAGLVVLSKPHMVDDVISNRIFEIASAGAVAICPSIPWIQSNFGDSVYYYDPNGTVGSMVAEIDSAMAAVRADPEEAAQRAARARSIFEAKFSAEVMIAEAVAYYETWRATAGKPSEPAASPLIDIVVRVGGRPLQIIRRALESLESQLEGRFRVVFVRYRDLDLTPLIESGWRRIEGFEIVDVPGGKRAATMCAGLKAVRSPLFAILDDDDFLLPDHFKSMLAVLPRARDGRAFIYSGFINVEEGPPPADGERERREIANLSPAYGDLKTITGLFAPNGFLASSPLIREMHLDGWGMDTAEDTLVVASLAALGDPHFCYRATAAHVVGSIGASDFQASASRMQDLMEVYLRLGPLIDELERKMIPPQMGNWQRLGHALTRALEQKSRETAHRADLLVLEEGVPTTSLHERDDVVATRIEIEEARCVLYGESRVETVSDEPGVRVAPPALPWAFGTAIKLDGLLEQGAQWVVVESVGHPEVIGVGLLNQKGDDFTTRVEIPASKVDTEMWLRLTGPEDVSAIMLQNWANPVSTPYLVKAAWLVKEAPLATEAQ